MTRAPLILLPLALFTSVASAQSDAPPSAPAAKPEKRVTIMWAPLRLIVPLFEVTGEYAVTNKIGASVTLGGGKRTLEHMSGDVPGSEIEGGVQGRYYVLGDFTHGMELGVEALYERVKFDEPLPPGILAVAAGGLTVGPFVGYKIATSFGFTFEGQLGARYLAMEPPVQGSAPGMAPIESKWLPLLHLNIGWSF